jgi:LuxR family maltose regulon positive regulatory protein
MPGVPRNHTFTSGCHFSTLLTLARYILSLDDRALKDAAMLLEALPLLRTKLEAPPLRAHTLPRERLLAQVPRAPGVRLLLLSAPAGFGKTTLLAMWCHTLAAQRGTAVAWLALEESDNDPARFLAYLARALAQALTPERLDGVAPSPIEPIAGTTETVLIQLVNAIATSSRDLVLVLDDYHLISAPAVHTAVNFLLEHLPNQACLAIGSRSDPPLPLARLRAREQLVELRASDLRFTPDEIQAFLAASNLALTPSDLHAIGAYVEGWPAGVQLVALALRAAPCEWIAEMVRQPSSQHEEQLPGRLSGSERHIFEYLAEDVFERQPAHRKAFLLQTAILDRMCGSLCDTVLGIENEVLTLEQRPPNGGDSQCSDSYSRLVLEEIEHANLFVIALDGQQRWYRYHNLFRAFLCARLERESPLAVAELHRRACAWYEHNCMLAQAVEHALAAGEATRAAELIESSAITIVERGEYATLHRWLEQIPEDIRGARPALCLWTAWTALLEGKVAGIELPLQRAELACRAAHDDQMLGEVAHLQAHLARLRLDAGQTIAAARRALLNLPEQQLTLRAGSMLALGAGQLEAGDLEAAGATLAEAFTQCQAHNFLGMLVALRCLGDLAMQRGQLHAAAAMYQEVVALVGARSLWERSAAAIRLGNLARERNNLDHALELLQSALAAAEHEGVAVYLPDGYIALARTYQARGDAITAALTFDRAMLAAQQLESPAYAHHIRAEQARLALATGDLEAVRRWQLDVAPQLEIELGSARESEALVLARVLIALGRRDQDGDALQAAYTILGRLREDAAAHKRNGSLIEILILTALAEAAGQRHDHALGILRQALLMAYSEGYARIFLDEGAPMQLLIASCKLQFAQQVGGEERQDSQPLLAYLDQLQAAFPEELRIENEEFRKRPTSNSQASSLNSQLLIEPLSERELEVLRLIAGGASNQAIAAALVISIGTVKSHINHILGKLSACNRTEAVSRARGLGLLAF